MESGTQGEERSRRVLGRIAELLPAMIAYWDASQRCVFANRAYKWWFGVTPESVIGMTMRELLGPLYPLNLPFIEGALRGAAQEFEREIPDPLGGPSRYSLANYVPDVEDGVVKGFAVLVTEITQRKRMEDELRMAKRAAEDALAQVRTLRGLLPICAWCGKIRDDRGYWGTLEAYLVARTDVQITHGLCESCMKERFPEAERSG